MVDRPEVQLRVDGDFVVVSHPELATNSDAALFFDAVLGAELVDGEWRCPRRRSSISALVVRINTYLESAGWSVSRAAVADEAVRNEIERKRSYLRTKAEAKALREGDSPLDFTSVGEVLREAGWNEDTRRLLPHQRLAVVHGLTAINSANFSVPGAGKTASTLAIAATHFAKDTIDLVVVVGPLSCFAPWEKETRAALGSRLTAKRVRGTAVQRRATYGRARRGDLLLLSYATAASDKLSLIELCRANRVMLVVDESHRVKRFRGGCWAPALMETAKFARIRVILSGTPMPQSGRDLYSQLSILWPSGELTGARDDFASRVDNDFASVLEDVRPFVSRTPKDALGLPPYEIVRHEVPLAPTQEEVYALIEGDFRKRLERTDAWADKIEVLKRAKPIRLLQAAANPDLLNKGDSFYS